MWSSFTYHEPSIVQILILSSWIYLLNLFGWISQYVLSAELLGQILIGIIFGKPLAGWLDDNWQETFIVVGYVGLLLIVFEGGLNSSFNNVISLLPLSICIALTGILLPIGLSFILVPLGSFSALHAFAAGSALSSTSLGTSLSILNPNSIGFDLRKSKLGTALLSAAVLDDIIAFVLSSILSDLGQDSSSSGSSELGKNIGRTIGVTIALGLILIPITKFILKPMYIQLYKRYDSWKEISWGGKPLLLAFMTISFIGMIAATGFAGTSPLYGAYLAGLICAYLSDSINIQMMSAKNKSKSSEEAFQVNTPESGLALGLRRLNTYPGNHTSSSLLRLDQSSRITSHLCQQSGNEEERITLRSSFEHIISPLLTYIFIPIFFGSIGYCIPFVPLWKGKIIWRGIIYAILMIIGKLACGGWLLFWSKLTFGENKKTRSNSVYEDNVKSKSSSKGAVFLGSAMVARGEIGLLISQIAYNTPKPLLEQDEFLIVNWGIILCTIVGPLSVGWIIRKFGKTIMDGGWD
ncbi:uncharacterized protein L201_004587 [Kwoniella dendrophila CBS 6074]|uniref:Cation/H+ exchanger transmembrane domain-containing protein n=1 Tax=Kwoniella dendrophila CBS 6074 TaxID=1295534 RepID=A0AAX4JW88_9TREE